MSGSALNELLADYELTIKELSETLVHELALRDELEYDKELKNQFISLLLTIQKKRRENNVDKKKKRNSRTINNNVNGVVEVAGGQVRLYSCNNQSKSVFKMHIGNVLHSYILNS